jgi:uncharacterized protein
MTKLESLKKVLGQYSHMAVAFSGGVDSTLLAKMAYEMYGENAIAITIHSNMHSNVEIEESKALAKAIGITHIVQEVNAYEIPNFVENDTLRCYHCKTAIFNKIKSIALKHDIDIVSDGTNFDDLKDYRPGLKALEELNIKSPLKDAGLTKDDIRTLSKELSLPTWSKAAFACLATRIPTGEAITEDKLRKIEQGENFLHDKGFHQYRVRCHGDLVRIEVDPKERCRFFDESFMDEVVSRFKTIGFKYVSLDLKGYTQGSMNHV